MWWATRFFTDAARAQDPTASAVISDLADAARHRVAPAATTASRRTSLYGSSSRSSEIVSAILPAPLVEDRPGVLAEVAGVLAEHQIGISSVIQPEAHEAKRCRWSS